MSQSFCPFHSSTSIISSNPEVRDSDDLEFVDTFGTIHWDTIVWLAGEVAGTKWPKDPMSYTFVVSVHVAGRFLRDVKTGIGRASFSSKYKDFWCRISLGYEIYREMSEAEFRRVFISLMTEAVERMVRLAEKKLIPVDFDEVRRKWDEITARYLAEPLPMRPPAREPKPTAPIPNTGVDYHFAFDTAAQRQTFLNKLKPLQLSVAKDKSEGRYWCTLTDEAATVVTEELESKLIQACGEFQGEYDGWAAPPSFKPTMI